MGPNRSDATTRIERVRMSESFPFSESTTRRWFRYDGSAWASNGHFAVRLPWIDIGGESFDDSWIEAPIGAKLFAGPFSFRLAGRRFEDIDEDYDGTHVPVYRYGVVALDRIYVDAIETMWPGCGARFTIADNRSSVAFVAATSELGRRSDVIGLVAPRVGPQFWSPPEWAATAKKILNEAECAATTFDNFAASMRVIIDRAKRLGVA